MKDNLEELKRIADIEWDLIGGVTNLPRTKDTMAFIVDALSRLNAIDSKLMEAGRYDLLG